MASIPLMTYVSRGGVSVLTGRVVTGVMGLLLFVILARLLPPDQVGAYFLAFNIAALCAILVRFGLDIVLMRLTAEALARSHYRLLTPQLARGVGLVLVLGMLVSLLFLVLGDWVALTLFESESLAESFALTAAWMILLSLQQVLGEIFRGFKDLVRAVAFGGLVSVSLVVVFLMLVWVLHFPVDLKEVLWLVVLGSALNLVIGLWSLLRRVNELGSGEQGGRLLSYRQLLVQGWALCLSVLVLYVLENAGILILAALRSESEVAVYGAVSRVVLVAGLAVYIRNALVPPVIAELNVLGRKLELEQILRAISTITGFASLLIMAILTLYGSEILAVVFGPHYTNGALALLILGYARAVSAFIGCGVLVLMLSGHQRRLLIITSKATLLGLVASVPLAWFYGVNGVAVAMGLALVIQQWMAFQSTLSLCGIRTHATVSPRIGVHQLISHR